MVTVDTVVADLSMQQRAVLSLSATGLISAEVADVLRVPVAEVHAHLAGAIRTLGAHSKLEAVIMALQLGLIELLPKEA